MQPHARPFWTGDLFRRLVIGSSAIPALPDPRPPPSDFSGEILSVNKLRVKIRKNRKVEERKEERTKVERK